MKVFNYLIIVIVALLSIAAGLAKVMQTPQEMEFLQGLGLTPALIIGFGVVQLAGGILLFPGKTRMVGAVLTTLAFLASSLLIFTGGNAAFGAVSLIPTALAAVILYRSFKSRPNTSENPGSDGDS